ncbi:MAG: HEAT repeat domain-containing protein [Halomonas sp.]|nr:HEAT repeat domain-containing protein [Halomonas sp.]
MPSEWLTLLPADPVLRLAFLVALALGLLTLLIMVQVLVLSEMASRRQRHRQAFNETWRPRFAMASLGDEASSEAVPALPRSHRVWFLLLWNRTQQQLRGVARERMNRLFQRLGMETHLLGMLRSRRVQRRLAALTCLGYLAESRHWTAVVALLGSRNPTLSLAAAQALVAIDPSRAMALLLPQIARRRAWAAPRIAALCQLAGPAAVTASLLKELGTADDTARHRLVPLLDWAEPRQAAPWARHSLDYGNDEAAMQAALHCLGELADPQDRQRIFQALHHDDPAVRLAAIEAFRQQATDEDASLLLPLLADRSWWVRQAVADTLVALPGAGEADLQAWLTMTRDRYGQDALRRAMLEERT